MPVSVQHEPANLADAISEHCDVCDAPTRYWHLATNTPLCPTCAEKGPTIADIRVAHAQARAATAAAIRKMART